MVLVFHSILSLISLILESRSYCLTWLIVCLLSVSVTSLEFTYSTSVVSGNIVFQDLPCLVLCKSVRIRSFSGPYFPTFGLNTERDVVQGLKSDLPVQESI